ncbi:hypothetical protein ACCS91_33330 [Rhizobium ruizarguesonis]|jgi:hypothetical protein|uniref:hypothetical protein n=1 Tax=Rhizobium ruizarguesonis TaxID=2081791 RepID=UPI0010310379|nr:hypothetical protein [Rhizobium ruizarguesonis]MBC2806570.1 hypothetical protein [Rhizobium ruizarguesonis]NEI32167.1 hypothetical protein [Rhizobium ruizarguesonis]TBB79112.1 hypothetical protein ELH38_38415 [Rhizobium ruizarguesonis]
MFTNTYQQGWDDAIHKRPKSFVGPSNEYRDGYQAGERYRIKERTLELIAVGVLSIVMGAVFLCWIAQGVAVSV